MFNTKRSLIMLIMFCCMASLGLSFSWQKICPNGDFETVDSQNDPTRWIMSNAEYSNTYAYTGQKSCRITAANGYCTKTFQVYQDFSSNADYSLHVFSFYTKNDNSSSPTVNVSYTNDGDPYYDGFQVASNLAPNQDWTQQMFFVCLPNRTGNITITLTGTASNIYIDAVGFQSYPCNGSFEEDGNFDITSGIKDTIPGFWQRGVTVSYYSGQVDYFTRGCVWASVNKNDIVNGNTDGNKVGLLSLPKSDGVFTQTFKGINFWRELQDPGDQFYPLCGNGNNVGVKAQCKMWTDTSLFSGVTAALIIHKLTLGTNIYSSLTTTYVCTNTPQLIETSEMVYCGNNNNNKDYGWVEINLLNPSSTRNKVMYIDEFKTLVSIE